MIFLPQRQKLMVHRPLRRTTLFPIPEDRSCHNFETLLPQKAHSLPSAKPIWDDPHVLINHERQSRGLPTLIRSPYLDELAKIQAEYMASQQQVSHTVHTIEELQHFLAAKRVGENVQRGQSCLEMHEVAMKQHKINRSNILSLSFSEFGVAMVQASDGTLYCCQYFRGYDDDDASLEQGKQ